MSRTHAKLTFEIKRGFNEDEPWLLDAEMEITNKEEGSVPDPVDLIRGTLRPTLENLFRTLEGATDDDFLTTLKTLIDYEIKETRYRIWEEQDVEQ
jgi:hypothetical protein